VPGVPAAASTTVLTEDDEYGGNASSDDDEEDVKPRARRATAKAAARLDDSSSGDDVPSASGNKLKRKQMASVGAPPQRTQLTKAELELGATLDLSRDELLNMTSDALEEHAKRLASQRTLTPEEQKRFKRQRRLIKNRESAQLSRMRKKAYVDELERQIADLKEEKDEIRRRADNAERQLAQARAETRSAARARSRRIRRSPRRSRRSPCPRCPSPSSSSRASDVVAPAASLSL
jgi:chromosome segregation ATPase